MLFRGNFLYYRNLRKGDRSETVSQLFQFSFPGRGGAGVSCRSTGDQETSHTRPFRRRDTSFHLNLKLQNAGKHSGKTLNCRLNLHQYWLRSSKLHSFTFQTYLKVDHWRRWWFTDHDDINSDEIGFDKNIRFLSFSNEIMEEISHFYINMRITAVSLSNWREIACPFILFLILSSK